jgi:hypothetical protein
MYLPWPRFAHVDVHDAKGTHGAPPLPEGERQGGEEKDFVVPPRTAWRFLSVSAGVSTTPPHGVLFDSPHG